MATGVVSCLGREIARAVHPNLLPGWVKRPADQGLEEARAGRGGKGGGESLYGSFFVFLL